MCCIYVKRVLNKNTKLKRLRRPIVCYQKPFRKVSRDTISRWVKTVLTDSGIDISRFKLHSTRAASTSAANNASVSLDDILQTAGWCSESTFAKYYKKPICSVWRDENRVNCNINSTSLMADVLTTQRAR